MGCRRIGPEPPTPNWRCCAAIRPTACPGVPGVGEKTAATLLAQHGSLEQILAAAHDPKSKMAKGVRAKLLAATDYIEAAGQVVRVATDAPVTLSTPTDELPLVAADPQRTAELATELGVGSSIGRLQKALDALPASDPLLRPADLVGALVVLEGHRHVLLGAVDADVAVEGAALLDGGVLAVVALDVFDVLRAVAVGLVAEDLLHAGLRLVDVQLGGDEEPGLPETEHQHDRDEQKGDRADHAADQCDRTLLARLLVARVLLRVLAGLPVLAWLGLAVLAGLAILARLAVLTRLAVLAAGWPYWPG